MASIESEKGASDNLAEETQHLVNGGGAIYSISSIDTWEDIVLVCDCKELSVTKLHRSRSYRIPLAPVKRREEFALRREEIPLALLLFLHESQNLPLKAAAMAAGGDLVVAANPGVCGVNWRSVARLSRVCEGARP